MTGVELTMFDVLSVNPEGFSCSAGTNFTERINLRWFGRESTSNIQPVHPGHEGPSQGPRSDRPDTCK